MENIIFERDYRRPAEETPDNSWVSQVFDRAINGSALRDYADAVNAIPKVIVPQDKENYEYLLQRCDEIAKRLGGYVKGEVDYHRWDSHIELLLPFAEFGSEEERTILKEIAEKAHLVTFTAAEDGGIQLSLMINYFEELMTEEHRGYLRYEAIMNDEKLASMLNMPELPPGEVEMVQHIKGILDRFEAETDIDRTTAFKAVLENMMKQNEENQTFEFMAGRLERLLEMVLNGEMAE